MDNSSCSNQASCLNLTHWELHIMFSSMISLFSLSVVMSCCAITMLFVIAGCKILKPCVPQKMHTQQLTLYILCSVLLYSVGEVLKILPVTTDSCDRVITVNYKFCQVSGFLLEYFALVTYILTFLTTIYFMGRFVCGCGSVLCCSNGFPLPLIILIIGCVFPALIGWIPFVGEHYRLAGAFCWINVNTKDCNIDKVGFTEEVVLYYVVVFTLSLVMFVTALIILCSLCGYCSNTLQHDPVTDQQIKQKRRVQLEFIPLLIYPVVFTIFFCIDVTQRVHFALAKGIYTLWMIHAVGGNAACVFVPLAFIIHPLNIMRVYKQLRGYHRGNQPSHLSRVPPPSETDPLLGSNSNTVYIVPGVTSQDDPLLIHDGTTS